MSKHIFNYIVPSEEETKCAEIVLYYMVLKLSSQEQLIPFCFKAIFFFLKWFPGLLQSYPFFDMLAASTAANKINSSRLDYTGIDW